MAASINNIPTVEFVIIPKEDLFLLGPKKINSLLRVQKDTPYPCVMQKPQAFSSMFRHYAKHNGLDKTTLRFFFVEELDPDQTPETVALMPHDIIFVSHVIKLEKVELQPHKCPLAESLGSLLRDDENSLADITFLVGPEEEPVAAHKAILCARCMYFRAMFAPNSLVESAATEVRLITQKPFPFRKVLEYIYTADIQGLKVCKMEDIFEVISLASEYLLVDLQALCETTLMKAIDTSSVCFCYMFSTKNMCCPRLQEYCKDFILANMDKLGSDDNFRSVVMEHPPLALLLVDYVSGGHKKRKRISLEGAEEGTELAQEGGNIDEE